MKKIYTYLTVALLAMTTTTLLTSCDDQDAMEARTLDGSWTGYIETYFQDRWGVTGNSYRTTMYFHQRDRYGGTGYEVDYNTQSRYSDYYYCEFDWEVYQGEIHIRYADTWDDVYIYDYRLTQSNFEGYMDDGTYRDIYFNLYYDGSFNWNPYRNDYFDYYNNYYAPTRSSGDMPRHHASGEFAEKLSSNP